jgi:hypothetical protein
MEYRGVALPWLRSGDYDEIQGIMSDGYSMSTSYEVWLRGAEADFKKVEAHGIQIERVIVEPHE